MHWSSSLSLYMSTSSSIYVVVRASFTYLHVHTYCHCNSHTKNIFTFMIPTEELISKSLTRKMPRTVLMSSTENCFKPIVSLAKGLKWSHWDFEKELNTLPESIIYHALHWCLLFMNILWKVINFVVQPDHGKYLLVLLPPVCGTPPCLSVAHQAHNHFPPWIAVA